MNAQTSLQNPDDPRGEQRYDLQVPSNWPHVNGRLHALLDFQDGKCGICRSPVTWKGDTDPECIATMNLRQAVQDDLLLGLVCRPCGRRVRAAAASSGTVDSSLGAFLAAPPGQQCPQTTGRGSQARPRHFDSRLLPTEVPSQTWAYSNTVMHSLFLWQRGRCAICASGLTVESKPTDVHVDHDPVSGLIRGLLCRRCNICLGQNWPKSWWQHHERTAAAYEASPPAQICPATKGLHMSQRRRPAVVSHSQDHREVLLDGLPMGIVQPSVQVTGKVTEKRWYAVRYAAEASNGYPPVLEASEKMEYVDTDGEWVAFFMDPPPGSDLTRLCILRLDAGLVQSVSAHDSMLTALAALQDAA